MDPRPFDPEQLLAHDGFVRAVARGCLRDEHAVDDVVQQTWLAALERGPAGLRSARAWLAAVARRIALRAHRADARRDARERIAARDEGVPSSDDILLREQARQEVVRAVLALEEPYRATLLLRYFEMLPPREIAVRQGVSVDTVQSRLQRGLARVRARLDRTQRSWAWALAAFARPEPAATSAATSAATTAMLLSAKAKAIAAAALVALLAAGVWWLTSVSANEGAGARGPSIATAAPAAVAEVAAADARETVGAKPSIAAPARSTSPTLAASAPAAETPSPPTEGWLASPDDPCGTLVVHVVEEDNGAPVEGIGVHVLPYGSTDPVVFGQWKLTDARGIARFARVPAGNAWSMLDRQIAQLNHVVVADTTTEITFCLVAGIGVEGRVIDSSGKPIEGADVLIDEFAGFPTEPFPVARTGAGGTFRIKQVQGAQRGLGARARGYAPSGFRQIPAVPPDAAEHMERVEIMLPSAGAEISGRVADSRGNPAARALVLIGSEDRQERLSDGVLSTGPAPTRVLADGDGRFHVGGIAAGRALVQARAHGAAPWSGEVEVAAGGSGRIEIRLEPELVVEGTARDRSGHAMGYAAIEVGPTFHFASRWIEARSDGSFRLPGLSPGNFEITAWTHGGLHASARLSGAPGETVRWDPVLEPPGEKR